MASISFGRRDASCFVGEEQIHGAYEVQGAQKEEGNMP